MADDAAGAVRRTPTRSTATTTHTSPPPTQLIEQAAAGICDAYEAYAPVPAVLRSEAPNIARALADAGLLADPGYMPWGRTVDEGVQGALRHLSTLASTAGKQRTAEWLAECAELVVEPGSPSWPPAPAYKGPMVPAAEHEQLRAELREWRDSVMVADRNALKREAEQSAIRNRGLVAERDALQARIVELEQQVAVGHRVQLAVAGQWLHHASEEIGNEAGADYLTRLGEWLTDGTEGDEPKLRAALQGDQPTEPVDAGMKPRLLALRQEVLQDPALTRREVEDLKGAVLLLIMHLNHRAARAQPTGEADRG